METTGTGVAGAATTTDRIEKRVVLRAPRARVWRALTDAEEFGAWFGFRMANPFSPGARVHGKVTTPGYEHLAFEMFILKNIDRHVGTH